MRSNPLSDFFDFIYPKVCSGCGALLMQPEQILCTYCLSHLPYTQYETLLKNPVFLNFCGRIPILDACSLLYFHKGGRVQHLLHLLKYDYRPDIGLFLGKLLGEKLAEISSFQNIDVLVPVPLHPKKIKKRGYNQCDLLIKGMQPYFHAEIQNHLLNKKEYTESQTQKNRTHRWDNVHSSFALSTENTQIQNLTGKHILLIDDVITTGATLESCARELLKIPNVNISIATIAAPIY
ncbi:MAG: phosphoribosyltransferase family protein [Bacteroidales bacterium]